MLNMLHKIQHMILNIWLNIVKRIRRYCECQAQTAMSWVFQDFWTTQSGIHQQMRLAASERSFNESYPLSFSRSDSDTCVNLIYAGTSDEFPPEIARWGGEKSARMRYWAANNSQDTWKSALILESRSSSGE